MGLARAFMTGIHAALDMGADVIINTNADNQYDVSDIPKLLRPILERKADMVVGAWPIDAIQHFTGGKKMLHKLVSWVVRFVSRTDIADAPNGFIAFTRIAAQ